MGWLPRNKIHVTQGQEEKGHATSAAKKDKKKKKKKKKAKKTKKK